MASQVLLHLGQNCSVVGLRPLRFVIAATIFTISGFVQSSAHSANVPFAGSVAERDYCIIVLLSPGALAESTDSQVLSSKEAGGVPGVADVFAGKNKKLSVDAPSSFDTMPVDGDNGVTFETFHSGASIVSGKDYSEFAGTKEVPITGSDSQTRISINLVATRTGDPYPGGSYSATAVLRCE